MGERLYLSPQAQDESLTNLRASNAASAANLRKYVAGAEAATAEVSAARAAAVESAAVRDMLCARADAAEAQLADSRAHAEVASFELAAMEQQIASLQAQVFMSAASCYLMQT